MREVTLVNRTKKTLEGKWDGVVAVIEPGEHKFPADAAVAYKRQNPIMGTKDPDTLQCLHKIGIVELNDDISPLEDDPNEPLETLNRELLGGRDSVVVRKVPRGLYGARKNEGPVDGMFGDLVNG